MEKEMPLALQEIVLKVQKRAMMMAFSPEVVAYLPDGVVGSEMEHVWHVGLSKYLPYNTLLQYMKPRDWWEAVKERWAPAWFKERWPVEYDTVQLDEILAMAVPKGCGDRMYVASFNGRGMALSEKGEERRGYCLFCKSEVPVLVHKGCEGVGEFLKPPGGV